MRRVDDGAEGVLFTAGAYVVPEDMATDFHVLVVVDVNDGDVGQGFPGVEVEVLAGDHLAQFHDEFGDQGFAGDGRAVFGVAERVGGFGDFGQGLAPTMAMQAKVSSRRSVCWMRRKGEVRSLPMRMAGGAGAKGADASAAALTAAAAGAGACGDGGGEEDRGETLLFGVDEGAGEGVGVVAMGCSLRGLRSQASIHAAAPLGCGEAASVRGV